MGPDFDPFELDSKGPRSGFLAKSFFGGLGRLRRQGQDRAAAIGQADRAAAIGQEGALIQGREELRKLRGFFRHQQKRMAACQKQYREVTQ